jgi:hypothetical protein
VRVDVSPVEVDITAAVDMLDGIAERAEPGQLAAVIERVARDGMGRITGIPVGETGTLSRSLDLRRDGDAIAIINTAPYARFVFRGTRHMDAQPPNVPAEALARELADAIAREVFR